MSEPQPTTTNKRKKSETLTWSSHYYSGVQNFKEKNYEVAVQDFDRAIELKPNRLELYDCRAAVYERSGNIQAAYRDAKKMITMFPSNAKGYIRAGKILKSSGRYEAAYHVYESGRRKLKSEDPEIQLLAKYSQEAITLYKNSQVNRPTSVHSVSRAAPNSTTDKRVPTAKCWDPLEILPVELVLEIFELLSYKVIWRCTGVSK
ncbi:hypothetical protein K7432_017372, partial [Basidiobolus ranarum]